MRFTVPGVPVAKARPRVYQTPAGPRASTPARTISYERAVAWAAAEAHVPLLEGPVALLVLAVFPRPKRLMRRRDPDGLLPAPTRPDLDNVVKAVLDGLVGIALRDDGQVTDIAATKRYAERDGVPRTEIQVMTLPAEPSALVEFTPPV